MSTKLTIKTITGGLLFAGALISMIAMTFGTSDTARAQTPAQTCGVQTLHGLSRGLVRTLVSFGARAGGFALCCNFLVRGRAGSSNGRLPYSRLNQELCPATSLEPW